MKKQIKLNLGCGTNFIPGFINVDKFIEAPEGVNYIEGDIRDLPFEKEYADYIICDNVLEHLPQADVPVALHEIRRVLKKGGRAVLIVPDFNGIARMWLSYGEQNHFDFPTHQFFSELIYGNQFHEGEYHRTPFYPVMFSSLLHMVGLHDFELIGCPKGMPVSGLKEFDGVRWEGNSVLRNDQLIAKITK